MKSAAGYPLRKYLACKDSALYLDTISHDDMNESKAVSGWVGLGKQTHPDIQWNTQTKQFRNVMQQNVILGPMVKFEDRTYEVEYLLERTWKPETQWECATEINLAACEFADLNLDFMCAFDVPPSKRHSLLIVQRPDMIEYFSLQNEDKRIGLVHAQSAEVFIWEHRVCGSVTRLPTQQIASLKNPCQVCKTMHPQFQKLRDEACEGVEIYFTDQLQQQPAIELAIRTGHLYSGKEDGVVRLKKEGTTHLVQYKLLQSVFNRPNQYMVDCDTATYPASMVIAATNTARNRFWIGQAKDIASTKMLSVTFSRRSKLNLANKFEDAKIAIDALMRLLPSSLQEHELKDEKRYSPTTLKEKRMREHFFKIAKQQHNLDCVDHDKLHSPIDFFCNTKAIQAKYSSSQQSDGMYHVACQTRYTDKDKLDAFVVQLAEFPDDFLIAPTAVMIELGYVGTDTQRGTVGFIVSSPNHTFAQSGTKTERLSRFWNAWYVLDNSVLM